MRIESNATKRAIAKLIDIFIFYILRLIPFIGIFIASLYILFSDAKTGFSVGKKIMGLKVVNSSDNSQPVSLKASFIRNLPILLFLITPFLSVLSIIVALFSFPLFVLETYLVFSDPDHERIGDLLASTRVISE